MSAPDTVDDIACNCLLSASRRLARVVTSIYDDELRPHGIKGSQLNLLVVVAKAGPIKRSKIGRYADIDPSTLTRNLAVMLSNGWIEEIVTGDDGRGNPLQVTANGRSLIEAAAPAWRQAQLRAYERFGDRLVAPASPVTLSNNKTNCSE